jgi:hypothetical protein
MVIVLILLVMGTAFCLLDPDCDMTHTARTGLCFGMLVAALVVVLLAGLEAAGWACGSVAAPAYAVAVPDPSPPPRLLSS